MKTSWNLADLIDLECLSARDERARKEGGERELAGRDRALYLTKIAPVLERENLRPEPRELLRLWLEARRDAAAHEAEGEAAPLPGALWREVTGTLAWLALGFGALSGLALAGAFLVYTGKAPLNVSAFLGIFVVLQLVLLAGQCLFFLCRRLFLGGRPSAVQALALRCTAACVDWAQNRLRRGAATIRAEQRQGFAALLGRLRARREQAGLLLWPPFLLMQLAGIGFNLGVIGLTLAKVVFSDMAFGWQSSLQVSAAQVANWVRVAALPWSWLLPEGVGYPGPEQVAGTKFLLKDGVYHLATQDLVSWWPFLCMALLVYGLLPRLLMLAAAFVHNRNRLARLDFRGPEFRRALQRMTTPQVGMEGQEASFERPARPEAPQGDAPPEPAATRMDFGFAPKRLVLAPEDVLAVIDAEALMALAAQSLGPAETAAARELPFFSDALAELLAFIGDEHQAGRLDEICLVQEAWMPPLQETLNLVERLRRALDPACGITVCLTGKPGPDGRPGPALAEHVDIWNKRLAALADPALEARALPVPAESVKPAEPEKAPEAP